MPTKEKRRGARSRWLPRLALLVVFAPGPAAAFDSSTCKFFSQLPDDCASAEQRKYDNLRGYRFEEIDLYARDVIKKILYVSIYNTTGQNAGDDTHKSAPDAYAEHVDPKAIVKAFHAVAASTSAPRYWAFDWIAERRGGNFDGLDAAWEGNGMAAESKLAPKSPKSPPEAYHAASFPRTAIEGYAKGSRAYVLDDPKGHAWVLAAYTAKGTPNGTVGDLDSLAGRLTLPDGWKFRSVALDRGLGARVEGRILRRGRGELGDIYHLAGPGQSNFTP